MGFSDGGFMVAQSYKVLVGRPQNFGLFHRAVGIQCWGNILSHCQWMKHHPTVWYQELCENFICGSRRLGWIMFKLTNSAEASCHVEVSVASRIFLRIAQWHKPNEI